MQRCIIIHFEKVYDIIVCGGTGDIFWEEILGRKKMWDTLKDDMHCKIELPDENKQRIFIAYYHPANRYPKILNYYGIANVYKHAIENEDKE